MLEQHFTLTTSPQSTAKQREVRSAMTDKTIPCSCKNICASTNPNCCIPEHKPNWVYLTHVPSFLLLFYIIYSILFTFYNTIQKSTKSSNILYIKQKVNQFSFFANFYLWFYAQCTQDSNVTRTHIFYIFFGFKCL